FAAGITASMTYSLPPGGARLPSKWPYLDLQGSSACARSLLHIDDRAHPWVNATHELVRTRRQSGDIHRVTRCYHDYTWRWHTRDECTRWREGQWHRSRGCGWAYSTVQDGNESPAEVRNLCKCVALATRIDRPYGLSGTDWDIPR